MAHAVDDGFMNRLEYGPAEEKYYGLDDGELEALYQARTEGEAITLYAGPEAEELLCRNLNEPGSAGHFEAAKELLRVFNSSWWGPESEVATPENMWEPAHALVADPANPPLILAVTDALQAHRQLTGEQVAEVMARNRTGPRSTSSKFGR